MYDRIAPILDKILIPGTKENIVSLNRLLYRKAKELRGTDSELSDNLLVLAKVFGMSLVSPPDPAQVSTHGLEEDALIILPESPEHLADRELELLEELVTTSTLPQVIARIADVLWIRRRGYKFASMAIEHYLDYAKQRESFEDWQDCGESLGRALQLAKQIGQGNPELSEQVVVYMDDILDRGSQLDANALSCYLLYLLVGYGSKDNDKYLKLSGQHARQAQQSGDWHKAEQFWKVHYQWARSLKNRIAAQTSLKNIVDVYVAQAKGLADSDGSFIAAVNWIKKAIVTNDTWLQDKDLRKQLNSLLREYQKRSMSELKKVSGSVEVPKEYHDWYSQILSEVQGKTLQEYLFVLAFQMAQIPDFTRLRQEACQLIEDHPFAAMVTSDLVDSQGRIFAQQPSSFMADPETKTVAERQMTLQLVRMQHAIDVQAIESFRCHLTKQHTVEEQHVLEYCRDNPFIEPGQELLYAKGLQAGLKGDFMVAAHLLIPLFENSLRYVLNQQGHATTKVNTHEIQQEAQLSELLDLLASHKVFAEDLILNLQAVLLERSYGNLRNRLAHGLLYTIDFEQPEFRYLWWFSLHLVLFGYCIKVDTTS